MKKTPKRKIMRSLFKQYKRANGSVFRYKATTEFLKIMRKV